MSINELSANETSWSKWKKHWAENIETASLAALLQAAGFLLFMYMFVQTPHFLFVVVVCALAALWCFNVGISALNAYLHSHPKISPSMAANSSRR